MIRIIINIYIWVIILDSLLSYFPQYKNQDWAKAVKKAADVTLKPIRKIVPQDLPFDISPIIIIILLNILPAVW
jgi:YggT family protein